jgi:hypothetical protein
MKGNKLIAEFMNVHEIMHDGYSEYDFDDNTLDVVHENNLKYHSSWDWLMPVVEKIYNEEGLDNELVLVVRDSVAEINIKNTYDSIIDYLNQQKHK